MEEATRPRSQLREDMAEAMGADGEDAMLDVGDLAEFTALPDEAKALPEVQKT